VPLDKFALISLNIGFSFSRNKSVHDDIFASVRTHSIKTASKQTRARVPREVDCSAAMLTVANFRLSMPRKVTVDQSTAFASISVPRDLTFKRSRVIFSGPIELLKFSLKFRVDRLEYCRRSVNCTRFAK
jgi:hypothetical protein